MYREAIELSPPSAPLHDQLGHVFAEENDHETAIAEFQEANRLSPANSFTHSHLGLSLEAVGDHAGAIAAFRQAILLRSDNTRARSNLIRLLGAKDLGVTEYPPKDTAVIDGDLGFRQHTGGHTPGPTWPTFITFASKYFDKPSASSASR